MLQPAAERSADTDRASVPEPQVALRVTDAAKAFGATQAVRSASIEVRAGEIHAIVGENGSGKSTLVKLLAGVHRPDSGKIAVGGTKVDHLASPRESSRARIATTIRRYLQAHEAGQLAPGLAVLPERLGELAALLARWRWTPR